MDVVAKILVGWVAVSHIMFGVMEMFLWQKPAGRKIFKTSDEEAEHGAVLAKNQGLYNYFLAAGLIWALLIGDPTQSLHTQTFFLVCVSVAGVYGAITAAGSILFVQALPALLALGAVWAAAGV